MNEKVLFLRSLTQPQQRSNEWYENRNKLITASEVASCLVLTEKVLKEYNKNFPKSKMKISKGYANPYESLETYIRRKCNNYYLYKEQGRFENFSNNEYTSWGKKYEPIATRFYSLVNSTKINEFGLITHQTLDWLAASPDGITNDGVMLEIKCPFTRKISIDSVKLYYWCQMQIQMEVCDLDRCDFLECEIEEISREKFLETDDLLIQNGFTGILIENCDITDDEKKYIYPDENKQMTKAEFLNWVDSVVNSVVNSVPNHVLYYFNIYKQQILPVNREKNWFENIKPDLKKVHDQIMKFQNDKSEYTNWLNKKVENTSEFPCNIILENFLKITCSTKTGNIKEPEKVEVKELSEEICNIDF